MGDQDQYIGSVIFLILSNFEILNTSLKQNFLTFDPWTKGQMKKSPWRLSMVDIDQDTGMDNFVVEGCIKIWPLIKTNLNFSDLWPLNHRSDEEVTKNTFW